VQYNAHRVPTARVAEQSQCAEVSKNRLSPPPMLKQLDDFLRQSEVRWRCSPCCGLRGAWRGAEIEARIDAMRMQAFQASCDAAWQTVTAARWTSRINGRVSVYDTVAAASTFFDNVQHGLREYGGQRRCCRPTVHCCRRPPGQRTRQQSTASSNRSEWRHSTWLIPPPPAPLSRPCTDIEVQKPSNQELLRIIRGAGYADSDTLDRQAFEVRL